LIEVLGIVASSFVIFIKEADRLLYCWRRDPGWEMLFKETRAEY